MRCKKSLYLEILVFEKIFIDKEKKIAYNIVERKVQILLWVG